MKPEELARPMPCDIGSEMCKRILDSTKWIAQEKINGWRCLWDGKAAWTRHGNRIDGVSAPGNLVIDGEWKDGVLYAFDLLAINGTDTMARPLSERWMRLKDVYDTVVPATQVHKLDAYREWISRGSEGMVLKRLSDPYPPAGGAIWLKVKP